MVDSKDFQQLYHSFLEKFGTARSCADLEDLRVEFLGKKSQLACFLSELPRLSQDQKVTFGSQLYKIRSDIDQSIKKKMEEFRRSVELQKLAEGFLDVTVSAPLSFSPGLHPLSKIIRRIHNIFQSMGFQTTFGSEIETSYFNFEALNMPEEHPARDLADTFFLPNDLLLRTQTSGIQIRQMQSRTPPLAIISPGRCFRKDEIDATHLPLFHQVEGLVVGKDVSFAELKGTLEIFAQALFGEYTQVRFRPDYFPFVEPGAEVALSCPICQQKSDQCTVCKGTGYIEVAGCGLVHPQVLENGGIDPQEYSGYAFGFGIERLAMIYYSIPDIRLFYENHPDFLSQFSQPIF